MNRSKYSNTPYKKFEIHQINSAGKVRDSPTSSILKTPTPIFVTTRSSSAKTKKLKFANGPVDLLTVRNGTHESNVSLDSGVDTVEDSKLNNNGEINFGDSVIEVAISPVKTMQVSPESWKAFLEYSKYNDYSNETEKTDYTYSRLSKYRHKEIIPGFSVRPNLCRSSISSRRSSYSLPSDLSSFKESNQMKSYDFNVSNQSDSEVINNTKMFSQSNKFVRSKYYLRSSNWNWKEAGEMASSAQNYLRSSNLNWKEAGETDSSAQNFLRSSNLNWKEAGEMDSSAQNYLRSSNLNWKEAGETDSSAQNYLEKENLVHSPSEKFVKSYAYSTGNRFETNPHHYGTIRSMDYDDEDIDEVDINPAYSEKHNYVFSGSNAGRLGVRDVQSHKMTDHIKNFFAIIFLYVTSFGKSVTDLFSKYVLRRQQNNWNQSPSGLYNWKSDNLSKYGSGTSWMPWKEKAGYSTGAYYSGGYYGQPRSWHQRIISYFYDRFSQLKNLIWDNSSGYTSYRYHDTSRRKRFWWFLIPLLLLAGSFLGYIDFFSNPKAILNIVYSWAFFIPSFLQYTIMIFIPWLIIEGIPYFILKALPNFITSILPYFFMNTVPFYFWVVVNFLASLSLTSIWNILLQFSSFFYNILMTTGMYFFNIASNLISGAYILSSKYLMLFYANFCMQVFHLLIFLSQFFFNFF